MSLPPNKTVTIKEIAKQCKVSPSTVSLVLNGSDKIKKTTRERVMKMAREMDYRPNELARSLVSSRSRCLSVTVPALTHVFSDVYFGEIISGIYQEANEAGYKIMLDIAQESFIAEKEYLNLLRNRRTDGMLYIASSIEDRFLLEFEEEPYPLILVNHYFPDSSLNFISMDYNKAAEIATDHLLGLGHRHIGLIIGTNTFTGLDFRDTFLGICEDNGIAKSALPWIGGREWDEQEGYEAAKKLMSRHPDLTAIMAGNDRMAIGAIRYLTHKNIRVPEDVSVMGMDDIPSARYTTPGLTTLKMDMFNMGRLSCQRLLSMLNGTQTECRELKEPHMVLRESTAPPAL
ncbi:MAG: LacI family DNA-binding transcriptional regulator [Verrucomicrobia bacterium]|nr:LacI family DNA-binding transcriptional regulator [Verrucomicrobiota bacterium]MCH8513694.1 LacI family transcriptional regulator [Kiritimatiellia bacterium]